MDYTLTYNKNGLNIVFHGETFDEYKETVGLIMKTEKAFEPQEIKEEKILKKEEKTPITKVESAEEANIIVFGDKPTEKPGDRPVTDGQRKLMERWHIEIPEGCTTRQAIDIIDDYKRAHGMEIRENPYKKGGK